MSESAFIDRRRFIGLAGAAAGSIALSGTLLGCSGSGSGSSGSSASSAGGSGESVALRYGYVAVNNEALSDLIGVAYNQGFLDEELAEVDATFEAVPFTKAGPAINAALAAGEIEIGGLGDVPAISAKVAGADTTLISVVPTVNQTDIVVPAGSGISSVSELAGTQVAVGTGTYLQRIVYQILESEGVSLEEVEFVNMAEVDAATAIASDSVDAAPLTTIKATTLALSGDATSIYTTVGNDEQQALSVFVSRTDFAEEHPDVVVAFFKGIIRAEQYLAENGVDALRQQYIDDGIDAEIVDTAFPDESYYVTSQETTDEVFEVFRDVAQLLNDYGIVDGTVDVDEWFDGSFYEQAAAELG